MAPIALQNMLLPFLSDRAVFSNCWGPHALYRLDSELEIDELVAQTVGRGGTENWNESLAAIYSEAAQATWGDMLSDAGYYSAIAVAAAPVPLQSGREWDDVADTLPFFQADCPDLAEAAADG
jgi:hypothetical protein